MSKTRGLILILFAFMHYQPNSRGSVLDGGPVPGQEFLNQSDEDFGEIRQDLEDYSYDSIPRNLELSKRSIKDQLARRSPVDKNFMRFGRSSFFPVSDKSVTKEKNLIRFSRGAKDGFIRFGRGPKDSNFMRFGRGPKDNNFMRFGRGPKDSNFMRFGRGPKDSNFMRFGRGPKDSNFMRFGRGPKDNNFMRFGRGPKDSNFMRFGRGPKDSNFMRFGRGPKESNFMRFGRGPKDDSFMRFGKSDKNFIRFGRNNNDVILEDFLEQELEKSHSNTNSIPEDSPSIVQRNKPSDNFMRFGKSPSKSAFIRFGKSGPKTDSFIRFGRNGEEAEENEKKRIEREVEGDISLWDIENENENQIDDFLTFSRQSRQLSDEQNSQKKLRKPTTWMRLGRDVEMLDQVENGTDDVIFNIEDGVKTYNASAISNLLTDETKV